MAIRYPESTDVEWALLASGFLGAGIFLLWWSIVRVLASDELTQGDEWRYDVSRINELRKASPLYRVFQPLMHGLARFNRRAFRDHESLPAAARRGPSAAGTGAARAVAPHAGGHGQPLAGTGRPVTT